MLSAHAFWAFSCEHYEKSGVKDACLVLQNEHGFNVNMLLLCYYLQQQKRKLNDVLLSQCLDAIRETDGYLKCLHVCRAQIKAVNKLAYEHLLKAELEVEKQQQQVLIATINQHTLEQADKTNNINLYLHLKGLEQDHKVGSLLATVSA